MDRRHQWLSAVCAVALLVGLVLVVRGLTQQQSGPPQPVSASTSVPPLSSGGASTTGSPRAGGRSGSSPPLSQNVSLPRSAPRSVALPTIGVDGRLISVGQKQDGSMEVPAGAQFDSPAWYRGSPTPGQTGPAVIVGHVDDVSRGKRSVFYDLGRMRVGQQAQVRRADGRTAVFTAYQIAQYQKSDFPTDRVYANTAGPELRLITCGGAISRVSGHYQENVVVYLRLTAVR